MKCFPLILAGGSGTRLWPLSRKNYPKQFLSLTGGKSLLSETITRASLLNSEEILIVSNDAHYFHCQDQLLSLPCHASYLLEPCSRNTAPAIASAAHFLNEKYGPETLLVILPSDHWIADDQAWLSAMKDGMDYAMTMPKIITYGIRPSSPKTAYGYIEAGEWMNDRVLSVKSFREKPDVNLAEIFIQSGNYYWNSGMFICRLGVYLEELLKYQPSIFQHALRAVQSASKHRDYQRLAVDAYSQCDNLSIDYAIMEHTSNAALIPINMPWSDLGCWTAVAEANQQDEHGNVLRGNVIANYSKNCFISSENTLVTSLGIQDQIIVVTDDAVLVVDKQYSQQVKDLVNSLPKDNDQLKQDHLRVLRPWGAYEVLAESATFKVKKLTLKPHAKLSLQSHQHRSEHWVVVSGEATVENNGQVLRLVANQSTYIPQQTRHRLSNQTDELLHVIEVQSGCYLGEDDIVRYDDVYDRIIETAESNG